jgi:type III secretion protein D
MTDDPVCELRVAAGPNRSAVALLSQGQHRIGSAIQSDIVLADAMVAPHHLTLEINNGSTLRELRVSAVGGSVDLDEGATIEPGATRLLTLPAILSIGESRIELISLRPAEDDLATPAMPAGPDPSARFAATVGLLLVLSVALITFGFRPASSPGQGGLATAATAAVTTMPRPTAPIPPVAAKVESLRAKLATIPDLAALAVTEEEGAVVLTGPIEPPAVIKLAPLQRWFDAEWSGGAVLINRTVLQANEPPPSLAIEAVWRGKPSPYVLVGGERFLEGAMVDGGWVIQRIEAESVLLRRQNRTVSVRF